MSAKRKTWMANLLIFLSFLGPGINKTLKEAPEFFTLFTIIIFIGIAIILIPGAPLIQITLWSQVINGVLLPVVLVCMMLMVNNKDIMGEYVNIRIKNIVGWVTIIVLILLTAILTFEPIVTAFAK
jgi:Mn2+/Fe2+ NRAMP family transporter